MVEGFFGKNQRNFRKVINITIDRLNKTRFKLIKTNTKEQT